MTAPTGSSDIFSLVRAQADTEPGRPALAFVPAHLEPERVDLSYSELVTQSEAVAQALARRVGRGERALLLLPTSPAFITAFLGCVAAGVIAVPVPVPYNATTTRRVLGVARDCEASLIVSLGPIQELAAQDPQTRSLRESIEWLLLDALDGGGRPRPLARPAAADVAFLQYTSGSTSTPRGVIVSHGSLLANEAAISTSFGVGPDWTMVSWLPLHHDMGLIGGLLLPLFVGGRGVVLDPLSFAGRPASWLEAISTERADISGGPNFAYDLCTRKVSPEDKAGLDLSSWKVAFNGAATVFPRTLRSFSEAFADVGFRPSSQTPCYGLAEATLFVTRAEAETSRVFSVESLERGLAVEQRDGDRETAVRELVAYDLPTHATVRVVDPATMAPAAEGRMGEILIAGPSNGSGYWGDDAASEATFAAQVGSDVGRTFVRTGDLGFVHGGSLFIEGRSKDLIVHRGRNLYPEDIEADVSHSDPDLRKGCGTVFGVPHDGDEAVVVYQEIQDGTAPERYDEIVARIRATLWRLHGVAALAIALVPARTVPKTSSGKLQRHAAQQMFLTGDPEPLHMAKVDSATAGVTVGLAQRIAATDPLTEVVTRALCEHLQAALGLAESPRPDESLASLGADSLLAVQLQYELEDSLGVALRPSVLLGAGSLREVAAAAVAQRSQPRAAPVPSADGPGDELTASQKALWFLQRAVPESFGYNVTRAFRVTGHLDVDALSVALGDVVRRHRSLRLNVVPRDGRPQAAFREDPAVDLHVLDARAWTGDQLAAWHRTFATSPFDLEHDPLLRAAILRRANDWLVVMSVHHIACDLASLAIIIGELAQGYAAQSVPDDPPAVSPAAIEDAVTRERGEQLAAFWRAELAGELPRLELPRLGSLPRERPNLGAGTSVVFTAPPEQTRALAQAARAAGVTLHNLLLTAFQVLLHRLTREPDILVGVPTLGRNDRRLASWVGHLVNVVPVRSSYAPATPFHEFSRQTQQRVLAALDHSDLALSEIIRRVSPVRDSADGSLFQAMFAYYSTRLSGDGAVAAALIGDPDADVPMGDCRLQGQPMPDYTSQADVCLNAAHLHHAIRFELQYDVDKVTPEVGQQLATTFMTLLAAVAEAPQAELAGLPVITADEAAALVAGSSGPVVEREAHYLDTFEAMVDRHPDVRAVDDGAIVMTYAEVDERANHVARRLRAAGVGVEANVVVCAERSANYLVMLLGIHKADGCYVPISPTEPPRRAAAIAAAMNPVAVIADATGERVLRRALDDLTTGQGPRWLDVDQLTAGRDTERPPRLAPPHAASYIMHTSGSTGLPKAAVATNAGMTNHTWQMVEFLGLDPEDCVGQTAPISVDLLVWQLLSPLVAGGRTCIIPEPRTLSLAGLLQAGLDGGVTVLELVPSAVLALLDAGLATTPGDLRLMIATGEALATDLPPRWRREVPGIPLYNAYGQTECTDDASIAVIAAGDAPIPVSVGRPLSNTTLMILDDQLAPVPVGVTGQLCVGGAGVVRGYRGDPRRTAEAFVPDPWSTAPGARLYRTGDLGRFRADGEIEFLGRVDSQVKIRGLRVEPGEVEAALRACTGVVDAAVRVHERDEGPILVGYVIGDDDLGPDEDRFLRGQLAERMPRYLIPAVVVRVPEIARTSTGKVDYESLSYVEPARPDQSDAALLDDPSAATVRSIWSDLLERDTVDWTESFFALGGHSLLAMAMIDRVADALGVELDIDAVFMQPRLGDFVAAVRDADPVVSVVDRVDGPRAPPGGPIPASAAQKRFWFLEEMDPGQPTYNMPGIVDLHGELDEDALEAALREVLARHDVLRARFSDDDGVLSWAPGSVDEVLLPRLDLRGPVAELGDDVFDRLAEDEARQPVDLRRGPPFQALLARLGPKDWGLFVNVHHIVCDGWSLSIFLNDLADAYSRRVGETTEPPDPIRYGFADYCREEQVRADRSDSTTAQQWQGVFDGPLARSLHPNGGEAAAAPGGDRLARWIDEDLADAVRALAGRTGTTPYMVIATAVAALMQGGAPERRTVVLGTLIAQRERPEWRRVVGPLLNVSILAVDVAGGDTGTEALHRARAGALRAYRSRHLAFQDLVSTLRPADGDGAPFEVMLVMQPTEDVRELAGLTTGVRDIDTHAAPYPLTIDVEPQGTRFGVSYRYAIDRFSRAGIEAVADRLHALVARIVAGPDETLAAIVRAANAEAGVPHRKRRLG